MNSLWADVLDQVVLYIEREDIEIEDLERRIDNTIENWKRPL